MHEDNRSAYPVRWSNLVVELTDGEVKTYKIRAGVTIATHLAEQIGRTGQLVIKQGLQTIAIPERNIRMWSLHETDAPPED